MSDEFFVGYLPAPRGLRRFLWLVLCLALLLGIAAAAIIASRMRDPGDGRWTPDQQQPFEGIYIPLPNPMLWTGRDMLLIVGQGKTAASIPHQFDGRYVGLIGSLLERSGTRMIELSTDPAAIREINVSSIVTTQPVAHRCGSVSLAGEIVDSKCYLGAMKPGDGKTHKACAVLCLRGGIPPMFRTHDADGRERLYLITGSDLSPIDAGIREEILPFVCDPVIVDGTTAEFGGLPVLEIRQDSVRRQ